MSRMNIYLPDRPYLTTISDPSKYYKVLNTPNIHDASLISQCEKQKTPPQETKVFMDETWNTEHETSDEICETGDISSAKTQFVLVN